MQIACFALCEVDVNVGELRGRKMSSKSDGQRRGSEDVDLLDFEAKKAEIGKQLRYGLPTTLNMSKVTTTTNVFKTEEDTDEVIEVTEVTRVTVDDSVVGCGTSETRERPSRCPFDWTFGVTLTKWATFIAVIDIVKGTFGLIFAAYLAASIFRLMTETPDFEDLKRRMAHTEFVYIFAYGATGWGLCSLSVEYLCGISFSLCSGRFSTMPLISGVWGSCACGTCPRW